MSWIESKYIGILSSRLKNFKRKSPSLYNMSCPFCGDSEHNSRKARGYIFEKKGNWGYYCHNCGISMALSKFIKTVDLNVYNEMMLEKIKDNKPKNEYEDFVEKLKKPVFMTSGPLKGLKKVSQLSVDDPVKKFVAKRQIPNKCHSKLFSCPNFMSYVNKLIPNKFERSALKHDELRLLIPFFNKENVMFAFQGRSLRASEAKYITIVLDETYPKVYGLDTVDLNRKTYVFEGPIDSMFVPNSIAVAGGEMVPALKTFNKDNLVIVYDNEPRSRETIKKLDKAIMNGYNVCFWPENINQKDVNDMILSGMTAESIKHIIDQNTHKDLAAKLMLTKWSKI